MKPFTTLDQLATALGRRYNCTVWEKAGKRRIYFNNIGHNTKKMQTRVFLDFNPEAIQLVVRIDCPSQPTSWIVSQQKELLVHYQKLQRYARRYYADAVLLN